jgi:hypothetical protein
VASPCGAIIRADAGANEGDRSEACICFRETGDAPVLFEPKRDFLDVDLKFGEGVGDATRFHSSNSSEGSKGGIGTLMILRLPTAR